MTKVELHGRTTTFRERVVNEKKELDEKLGKLKSFIEGGDTLKTLPHEEQARLNAQYHVMTQYSDILGERIAAFGA